MPLNQLDLSDTPVSDLSPLSRMALTEINLIRADVTDLTPLNEMGRLQIKFSPAKIARGMTVLKKMPADSETQGRPDESSILYSALSACTGSTRVALRTGTVIAAKATTTITATAAAT